MCVSLYHIHQDFISLFFFGENLPGEVGVAFYWENERDGSGFYWEYYRTRKMRGMGVFFFIGNIIG